MPLTSGTRLGPYEIVAPLGAGGMGEVYRARDTRLGRDVAVKVLPQHLSSHPEIRARFEREAKTVSSLNHPSICTLHDVGREGNTDYLVMELIEGETLAQRLTKGPLPPAEVLRLGGMIADALDRAHRAGVTHRDLKPGNVMLTKSGLKLMDFGLARATGLGEASQQTSSPTVAAPLTAEGSILGTFQYMAPEQLEGKESDARADLWSLGCVLYEMATGQRAFAGATQASLISSIMRDQPRAMSELMPLTPKAFERVVRQCLAKDPDERWQSARDVAHELQWIATESSQPDAQASTGAKPGTKPSWLYILGALALVAAVGSAAYFAGSRRHGAAGQPAAAFHQLSYTPQSIFNARFSPDGKSVYFSGAETGTVPELFEIQGAFPEPRPLGLKGMHLLSVSSRGELAVLTQLRFEGSHRIFTGTLSTLPIGSAAPRAVLEEVREADWSPDGAQLAIIRSVGGVDRLEFPIGTVLHQAPGYLSDLRVSPRGDKVAFFEHPVRWDDRGEVLVVDLKGHPTVLASGFESLEGLAWDADADRVLFTGTSAGSSSYSIYAAAPNGTLSTLIPSPNALDLYDARPGARWLVARDDMRTELRVLAPGAKEERDLSWLDFGDEPTLSLDGRFLFFTEQAEAAGPFYAVCMRGSDGSPVLRLGDGRSCGASPDGKWVLALIHSAPPKLMLYPTGPGQPRQIAAGAFADILRAEWYPDGTKALVCGSLTTEPQRCFAVDLAGGSPRPVTPEGTSEGTVSPDGKTVIAADASGRRNLYPLDGSAPRPVPGLAPHERVVHWNSDSASILVAVLASVPFKVEKVNLTTGARSPVAELAGAAGPGALYVYGAGFIDDGRYYAYSLTRSRSYLYDVRPQR